MLWKIGLFEFSITSCRFSYSLVYLWIKWRIKWSLAMVYRRQGRWRRGVWNRGSYATPIKRFVKWHYRALVDESLKSRRTRWRKYEPIGSPDPGYNFIEKWKLTVDGSHLPGHIGRRGKEKSSPGMLPSASLFLAIRVREFFTTSASASNRLCVMKILNECDEREGDVWMALRWTRWIRWRPLYECYILKAPT